MIAAGQGEPAARRRRAAAAVVLLALAAWLPALRNGYTYDDVLLVRDDPRLGSLANVPGLVTSPYWAPIGRSRGLWRPLTTVSWAVDKAFFGEDPAGAHLLNLLAHAAAALAGWGLLRRLGAPPGEALLAAGLFAVHPLHGEAVAGLVGRAESLGALFGFAGVQAALSDRPGRRALGFALLAAAALFKESGAVFLVFAPLAAGVLHGRRRAAGLAAAAVPVLLLLAGARLAILGTLAVAPARDPIVSRGLLAASMAARYGEIFLWPFGMRPNWEPILPALRAGLLGPRFLGEAAALAAFAAWALGRPRRRPARFLAATLLGITLFPVLGVVPIGISIAERAFYAPSLGACLLLARIPFALSALWCARALRPGFPLAPVGLAAAACLGLSWRASGAFRTNLALFREQLRWVSAEVPRTSNTFRNLAAEHAERGRLAAAERCLEWVRRKAGGREEGGETWRVALAEIRMRRGDPATAEALSAERVREHSADADAWLLLGGSLYVQGRDGEARAALRRALSIGLAGAKRREAERALAELDAPGRGP